VFLICTTIPAKLPYQKKISKSQDAFEIFHSLMGDLPYEEFWLLLLNRANRVIKKVKISEGGISGMVVDPKKSFRFAWSNIQQASYLGTITPLEQSLPVKPTIR